MNPEAQWRSTLWSHETYMADLLANDKDVPELFSIVGLRLEGIMIDVLHAIDLGV